MPLALRRFLASLAILAFTGTFGMGAGIVGHGGPDDDAACRQTVGTGAHTRAQLETAAPTSTPTHCPFCHWQRMVSGASIVSADLSAVSLDPIDIVIALSTRAFGS